MDPFNKLPAELRTEIIVSTWCPRTISKLIQASPVMLEQYTMSKKCITKSHFTTLARQHCRSWATQQFPNPTTLNKISKLHEGLMFFIEDYLSKATAVFPPREYLCLPSETQPQLQFKEQPVCPRFNAAKLTGLERRRLLRAFLRYQLNSLIDRVANPEIQSLCKEALHRYGGQEGLFTGGAMFAQCGDSWLPEKVPASDKSDESDESEECEELTSPPGLLYPNNIHVNPENYADDMGWRNRPRDIISALAGFGFDLVKILLRFAAVGQSGRDRLRKWFIDSCPALEWSNFGFLFQDYRRPQFARNGKYRGSGMYDTLSSNRVESHPRRCSFSETYQQRAWVFLDDARFYPSPSHSNPWQIFGWVLVDRAGFRISPSSEMPHFPTRSEYSDQRRGSYRYEDNPEALDELRAQHRSQKWHDEQGGISPVTIDDFAQNGSLVQYDSMTRVFLSIQDALM
ncbi:hypothetical protein LY78DRAFT_750856 [Colletotrichum sublineola]|nr:hypothetical protein LY78DRAFT_750856 [Colletotrichum sublineola]